MYLVAVRRIAVLSLGSKSEHVTTNSLIHYLQKQHEIKLDLSMLLDTARL